MRLIQKRKPKETTARKKLLALIKQHESSWKNNCWQEMRCPITQEPIASIPANNVILFMDGRLYEKTALLTWLSINPSSPVTRLPLTHYLTQCDLVPPANHHVRNRYPGLQNLSINLAVFFCLAVCFQRLFVKIKQIGIEQQLAHFPCQPKIPGPCTEAHQALAIDLLENELFYKNQLSQSDLLFMVIVIICVGQFFLSQINPPLNRNFIDLATRAQLDMLSMPLEEALQALSSLTHNGSVLKNK